MKTVTVIALPFLIAFAPVRAGAQDLPADRPLVQASTTLATGLAAAADLAPAAAVDPDQVRPVAPPPPPPKPPRRRGSMVGYIDDPLVSSKVRMRFDIGMHIDTPDRSEFFYAKCGCYRDLHTNDPAYDPNAPGPRPGAATDLNFQEFYVQAEYAVKPRMSVVGELPIRWLQPQAFVAATIPNGGFTSQAGLSDIKVGAKYEMYSTDQTVASLQAQFFLPSGNAADGLGTNNVSFEPAFLIYQQTSNQAINVEGEVALRLPFGGSKPVPTSADGRFAGNVLFYGIGPSFEVYRSGRYSFAPVVELAAWHVFSGFQTGMLPPTDASGTNIVNLKFGGRFSIEDRGSIYVGYGHALTDAKWYSDIVRFEYRYMF